MFLCGFLNLERSNALSKNNASLQYNYSGNAEIWDVFPALYYAEIANMKKRDTKRKKESLIILVK